MTDSPDAPIADSRLGELLDLFPRLVEYRKGQLIYGLADAPTNLYLVLSGLVTVSRAGDGDIQSLVVDIYHPNEFFGESVMLTSPKPGEQAIAHADTLLRAWSKIEIEGLLMKDPRLALALMRMFAERAHDLSLRIASFRADNIARRLARSLIRFSEGLDKTEDECSVGFVGIVQTLLAQSVGEVREAVTVGRNQFRRQGLPQYSRNWFILSGNLLQEWLRLGGEAPASGTVVHWKRNRGSKVGPSHSSEESQFAETD